MKETANKALKIRPAGRHILTIGSDLIKDDYSAIVELVKNSYDADATSVEINIEGSKDKGTIKIAITDDGHGMSLDTIENKWLVPSTDDKLKRKTSPKGRIMQGRKGIGRYAASILGNEMLMDTCDKDGNNSTILLNWEDFAKAEYLNDVDVLLDTRKVNKGNSYTQITMTANSGYLDSWLEMNGDTPKKIAKLDLELRKLVSPFFKNNDDFDISIVYSGLTDDDEVHPLKIEELPILDYFDYRISGYYENDQVHLTYDNQKQSNTDIVNINQLTLLENTKIKNIGKVEFDIRVYDRDKDDIENLISRGLKDLNGKYLKQNEVRNILNEIVGVGVYRNGFRIRPLGDPGYDWLNLDSRRVQNPSMRIGSNQVVGFINIESEEKSGLYEKSARDGLKEDANYESLLSLFYAVVFELEERRFNYRRKTQKSKDISETIKTLYDYGKLKDDIKKVIKDKSTYDEVEKIIQIDEEKKFKATQELENKIAVYQGQATLGKIMNVVLHEGRKPLNYFTTQPKVIKEYKTLLEKSFSQDIIDRILKMLDLFTDNTKLLSSLFKRLDPLAAGKRDKRKVENLKSMIEDSFKIFEETLDLNNIECSISCPDDIGIFCWKSDIYVILTNLIDNSIYWLNARNKDKKNIFVDVEVNENDVIIDFIDNGPGIKEENIESGIIFEPEYSTKEKGTGLGLALAGEASKRNEGELKALYSDKGAYFRIEFKKA